MPRHNDMHDIDKLIAMVKNRPAIYDYSCSEHTDKNYIDILWKEIADTLQITPNVCKAKWLALRNSYSREIRNEKNARVNARGNGRKRRKWYLAESMSFLRQYLNYGQQKKRGSVVVIDEKIEVDQDDDDGYSNFSITNETCSSFLNEKTETKYIAKEEENEFKMNSAPSQSSTFETVQQTPVSTSAVITARPIEDPFKERVYPRRSQHEATIGSDEQTMIFFKSILPDVMKLSERRQRLFKQEILSVLNKSLDEQEMGS